MRAFGTRAARALHALAAAAAGPQPGLNLYWTFDHVVADGRALVVSDESGNGNHGILGDLPSVSELVTFSTKDAPALPTVPRLLRAGAPAFGSGVVDVWVPVGASSVRVNLTALDDGGGGGALEFNITSLPALGTLSLVDGGAALASVPAVVPAAGAAFAVRVVYTPGVGFAAAGGDSFTCVRAHTHDIVHFSCGPRHSTYAYALPSGRVHSA